MFYLHRNSCIYTVYIKLVRNVINYIISNAFLSFSIDHAIISTSEF